MFSEMHILLCHKRFTNEKAKFKIALKLDLNTHSFYSVDEFLLAKTESAS
jgi:hypothetical protein